MQTHTVRLNVITDSDGKVLATKPVTPPDTTLDMPAHSRLVAGPEQELHDIEVEIPENMLSSWDPTGLHEIVQARIDEIRSRSAPSKGG
jgi:hypothetical protein